MKKIVSTLMVIIVSLGMLISCNAGKAPKEVVEDYFKDSKKGTSLVVALVGKKENLSKKQTEMVEKIIKELEYDILNEKISKNTAVVNVKVKAIDLKIVMEKYIEKVLSDTVKGKIKEDMTEEELNEYVEEELLKIVKNKSSKKEKNLRIELKKVKGIWQIQDKDDILGDAFNIDGFNELYKDLGK